MNLTMEQCIELHNNGYETVIENGKITGFIDENGKFFGIVNDGRVCDI